MSAAAPHTGDTAEKCSAKPATSHRAIAAALALPLLLVVYLGVRDGGYGEIVRDQVGIVVWLLVLFGSLTQLLPLRSVSKAGWATLGTMVALLGWTALAMLWSESREQTAIEIARVATLLGVLTLALALQRRGSLRATAAAVGCAIAIIAMLALGSRLLPDLFPANDLADTLPTELGRLAYPLDYWNGLAALMAVGVPLLIWLALDGRNRWVRAVSCAGLPLLVLVIFYTLSRGGFAEAAIGVLVMAILMRERLRLAAPLLIGGVASVLLIAAASRRPELSDNLMNDVADRQALEMLVLTIVACSAAGIGSFFLQRRVERTLPTWTLGRVRTRWLTLATGLVAVIAALALNLPGEIGEAWEQFKRPTTPQGGASRFQDVGGSGRYQWWSSALGAAQSEPLLGIGPGTYQYWFARDEVELAGATREAHSLYLEALAELGPVGLLLTIALIGGGLTLGVRRARQRRALPRSDPTALPAAATGAMAAFAASAAVDWSWEMTVLPVTFLLLLAGLAGSRPPTAGPAIRISMPIMAAISLILITPPMLSAIYLDKSQQASADDRLADALSAARRAEAVLPFAATPLIQQAQILRLGGQLDLAAEAAQEATERESTNWRPWYVLSGIDAQRGQPDAALAEYRRARELAPRALTVAQPPVGLDIPPGDPLGAR